MKKLLVAAIVVLMASPAFAAIQNVKVSGDITSTYLDRQDFDLGLQGPIAAANGLKSQNVFLTQTRLRVDADLSDNVSTTVGLINERAWSSEANVGGNTSVDLYLASVTMRELLYSPLTVTVGRQVFNYGNGLIIGDGGPNNGASAGALKGIAGDLTMRTAYDGVKAVLDYKPLTIDMFYFKNDQNYASLQGLTNNKQSSSDFYGLNANYQLSDPMNTVVEGYLFSRMNGKHIAGDNANIDVNSTTGAVTYTPTSTDKNDTLYVPGMRVSTNPVKGLNVQGEVAWQLGNKPVGLSTSVNGGAPTSYGQESERRNAMAAQLMASYALPVMEKYKPSVNASYTYVSGDKDAYSNGNVPGAGKSTKVYSAWDPMNEAQGAGTIYNTLLNLTDMNIIAIGASVNPLEDVTVSATWSDLWAAKRYGLTNPLVGVQPNGYTSFYIPTGTDKKIGLGNETDVNMAYNYTEDVTFGVSLGWFVPGNAYKIVDATKSASQALANVAVKF
jgi:hypothetical protein